MKKLYAICQVFCAIVLMSALVGTASAQIVVTNGNPYTTGFENGLEDWTTQANVGTDVWSSIVGEHHAGSRSVNYSSSLFGDFLNIGQGSDDPLTIMMQLMSMMTQLQNLGSESAYLISPVMDLGGTGDQATLTFFRKQTSMMTPQILYVMYRTSPSAQWMNLQQYTNTTDWTQETITLPFPSSTYQVAFMGLFNAENMGNDIDIMDFMDPDAMTNFASDIFIDDITITSTSNTGVSEHSNLLSISPNPTSDIVRCDLNGLNNVRLQVLDIYGKLLMEQTVTNSAAEIDLSDKASGVYFLRVVDGHNVLTTQKVIRR